MKKIIRIITNIIFCLKFIIIRIIYRKNVFILCNTPTHSNIGDHAITIAEKKFLKDNFKNYHIFELDERYTSPKQLDFLKKIIRKEYVIILQGGGFMGDLWPKHEINMQKYLDLFNDNKKIIFPQTIYFEDDSKSLEYFEKYNSFENILICVRERKSYEILSNNIKKHQVCLVPDIVLYLQYKSKIERQNIILFNLRDDKEKVSTIDNNILNNKYFEDKKYTTKQINNLYHKRILPHQRNRILKRQLNEYFKAKIVITDRLHGMIFAKITDTCCIAFDNKSKKVSGVYEWIDTLNIIKISENDLYNDLSKILHENKGNLKKLDTGFENLKSNIIEFLMK